MHETSENEGMMLCFHASRWCANLKGNLEMIVSVHLFCEPTSAAPCIPLSSHSSTIYLLFLSLSGRLADCKLVIIWYSVHSRHSDRATVYLVVHVDQKPFVTFPVPILKLICMKFLFPFISRQDNFNRSKFPACLDEARLGRSCEEMHSEVLSP